MQRFLDGKSTYRIHESSSTIPRTANMTAKRRILTGILFLLLILQGEAMAQNSNSSQDQQVDNTQQFGIGDQNLILPGSSGRGFSIPGGNPMPFVLQTPPHFAPPVTDGNFGSLFGMLGTKRTFSEEEARTLQQSHGKVRVITTCYLRDQTRNPKNNLLVLADTQENGKLNGRYEQIGIGNYKALDADTISEQILGIAVMEGLKMGADAMVFQEGAALVQSSRGYSTGLFNSYSLVNSAIGSGYGNVAVGGLSLGGGRTAYSSNPWLRVIFLRETALPPGPPQDHPSKLPRPSEQKGKSKFEQQLNEIKPLTPEEEFMGTHAPRP